MTKEQSKWFQSWFDTPYYHTLYENRDYKEAEVFIKNIVKYLNLDTEDSILDLACGKGRHSIFLNKMGYNVTGVDISPKNIKEANEHKNENLKFKIQKSKI